MARSSQTFREIQRNNDSDQTGTGALQQASEDQRTVPVRQGNYGDADDEHDAADRHEPLAAHPVGQQAGEESGDDAAQEHGRHDDGEFVPIQARGRFQIGKGARDDAHVDAVKQAAESGDNEEKAVVENLLFVKKRRNGGCELSSHGFWGVRNVHQIVA